MYDAMLAMLARHGSDLQWVLVDGKLGLGNRGFGGLEVSWLLRDVSRPKRYPRPHHALFPTAGLSPERLSKCWCVPLWMDEILHRFEINTGFPLFQFLKPIETVFACIYRGIMSR